MSKLLVDEILYEIDWRTKEISIIRTVPYLHRLTLEQKNTLEKYSVLSFYALWEGFVTMAFNVYVREINKIGLSADTISINLLMHDVDCKFKLSNARANIDTKLSFVSEIYRYFSSPINVSSTIPTESNVNFKVINNILFRHNLRLMQEKPFKKLLNKLILIRNSIAHGETSIPIDDKLLFELSSTTISAIHEVGEIIIEGYNNNVFLK